jgi:predicted Ser/Thr protein kinase
VVIAYKKSRISLRVKRTILRHEARVMQLLQGHPAIPQLVGYHRGNHFEYMGMELLGMELKATVQDNSAVRPGTVARVGKQIVHISVSMLAILQLTSW